MRTGLTSRLLRLALGGLALATVARVGIAADAPSSAISKELDAKVSAALEKGRGYLLSKRDESTGAWGGPAPAGFSALAACAWMASLPPEQIAGDAALKKTLDFVVSKQRPDGSIASIDQFIN